jgi:4-hydroxythreonine-4-phosphate dehydrogenase
MRLGRSGRHQRTIEYGMTSDKPIIAIATGDPAGIGPEISLKAALDPAVRAACRPILVGDVAILHRHAEACGLKDEVNQGGTAIDKAEDWLQVLNCPQPETIPIGQTSAAAGRASIAFCAAAVKAALAKHVDAVVAAPQNETSIAMAGIRFDGHPSFVARETGTAEDNVFMMLCFGDTKIAHATLHQSVRQALAAITRERVGRVIDETARTLRRMGIAAPKIAVSGLNPHAGEGGLFGREEIEIIKPAIDAAAAKGVSIAGPFGADTMFHMGGVDAFIVMLHDQGHIAAKLLAQNAAAALAIGTPILFSSVAHGSAHDIAGKGIADPTAMIEAVLRMAKAPRLPANQPRS